VTLIAVAGVRGEGNVNAQSSGPGPSTTERVPGPRAPFACRLRAATSRTWTGIASSDGLTGASVSATKSRSA
jgi:hypothetical protein